MAFRTSLRLYLYLPFKNVVRHSNTASRVVPSASFKEANVETKRKPKKPPIVKNLFLGTFDEDLLNFPELENEKLWKIEELADLIGTPLNNIGVKEHCLEEQLKVLKQHGLLGMFNGSEYGGKGMEVLEAAKLCEIIGLYPSLAITLEMNQNIVCKCIEQFGNGMQKENFLKKLATGQWLSAYAMCEDLSGLDPTAIKSSISQNKSTGDFVLNGEKIWIPNAESADIFLVFAQLKIDNLQSNVKELSAFLVERGSKGIEIESHHTKILNELHLNKVKFKDVIIPKENLLGGIKDGYSIATSSLNSHKLLFSTTISSNLKIVLSDAIGFLKENTQSVISPKDSELVQKKIGKIVETIYIIDSVLYLTNGIIDQYECDTSLESSIAQVVSVERGIQALEECLTFFGARSLDSYYPYVKIWTQLKGFFHANQTSDLLKLYISLIGIQHAGFSLNSEVKKLRNPFNFPKYMLKKVLSNRRNNKDDPKLTLNLYENLHPSLKVSAEQLEYCVLRLQYAVEVLLTRYGSEIIYRQVELTRISDVVTDIYVMSSVLSRASRAYCIGLHNSDYEITVAKACCQEAVRRVKVNVQDVVDGIISSNDLPYLKIGSTALQSGSYFYEHPLKRVI